MTISADDFRTLIRIVDAHDSQIAMIARVLAHMGQPGDPETAQILGNLVESQFRVQVPRQISELRNKYRTP
ncbi:MAG: hypothetical protein ABSF35_14545 [Polyangia bacterium]|jgi:hypothetical protein